MKKMLKYLFGLASGAKLNITENKFCVNYVWINDSDQSPEDVMCSVPLHYLDRAYENARKYPDAKFLIWIDKNNIDPLSEFFVTSHGYLTAPRNVEFRNLREIPIVRDLDVFQKGAKSESFKKLCEGQSEFLEDLYSGHDDGHIDVWARVDLARLLVLKHNLDQAPESFQIYSDFDMEDVNLRSEHMYKSLLDKGIYLGVVHGDMSDRIENGFLAFAEGIGREMLDTDLISDTVKLTRDSKDGWICLVDKFTKKCALQELSYSQNTGMPLPEMGYKVPQKQKYKDWGLN